MPRAVLVVLVALLAGVSIAATGCGSDERTDRDAEAPATQTSARPAPDINQAAVLRSLQEYARLYNAGSYAEATRYLSDQTVDECGGALATALALAQNHELDGIDFRVTRVRSWEDGSRKADVQLVERIKGVADPSEQELGLGPFIRQRGEWVMDDLYFYPLGAGAFCDKR